MKIFTDLFPVILFFVVFKLTDIYAATAAAMAAAAVQAIWLWLRNRRLTPMQIAVPLLILALGALTLGLQDPVFIIWKPTLVNWAFAAVLLAGELFSGKGMLERMLSEQLQLPKTIWRRLSAAWIGFFLIMGLLNLFVAYRYQLDTWVDFKLYGVLGLTLLFALLQGLYLGRHLPETQSSDQER